MSQLAHWSNLSGVSLYLRKPTMAIGLKGYNLFIEVYFYNTQSIRKEDYR